MISYLRRFSCFGAILALCCAHAFPQVIEFESGGLKYQTLTKKGVTVMYASMSTHLRNYAMVQVAVSNGSQMYWSIRPEDFSFEVQEQVVAASPARQVVSQLLEKGSQHDVVKLVSAYESALYGIQHMKLTNGYEQRRRNALAEGTSARFKAAAAASAIALVATRLAPGQSTDGAVFFPSDRKLLAGARLVVHTGSEVFEFNSE